MSGLAAPGTRNEALNKAAFSLGQLVGAGHLTGEVVVKHLYEASIDNGLIKDDGENAVLATIESGLNAGIANPRSDVPFVYSENLTEDRLALEFAARSMHRSPV